MEEGAGKIEEEMREAREDIEGDEARHDGTGTVRLTAAGEKTAIVSLEGMEAGKAHGEFCAPAAGAPCFSVQKGLASYAESVRNFCSYLLGPVFVQAFVLTFLGEWGDRSQISTIALAAADVRAFLFIHVLPMLTGLCGFRTCMWLHWVPSLVIRSARRSP